MKRHIDVRKGGALFNITVEGESEPAAMVAFLSELVSHPQWRPGSALLIDHRASNFGGFTPSNVRAISRAFQAISTELGDGKFAVVTSRDVDVGIVRARESIAGDHLDAEIFVFRDIEKALFWLEE